MPNALKRQIVSGIGWQTASTIVQGAVQTVLLIVFARFLSRADFGIIAVANILLTFLQLFVAAGAGPGLVQKQTINDAAVAAACWLSAVIGLMLSLSAMALSDVFSAFMHADSAGPILRVLSINLLVTSLAGVPQALLQRNFDFRYLSLVTIVAWLFGYGACGIYAAVSGMGAWAIVVSTTATNLILLIGYLYKVSTRWAASGIKDAAMWLLNFGTALSLVKFLNFLILQVDRFVVGRRFTVDELGRYHLPAQLVLMPSRYVGDVMDKVMFPALSRAQNDPQQSQKLFISSTFVALLTVIPVSLVLIFYAPVVIRVFLGAQWLDISLLLSILAFGLVIRTVTRLVDTLARSRGALYRIMPIKFCTLLALLIGSVMGSSWGLIGIAIGMQAGLIVGLSLSCRLMLSLLEISARDLAASLAPAFAFVGVFVVLGSISKVLVPATSPIPIQLATILIVCLVTSASTYFCFRSRFSEYIDLLRSLWPLARASKH